MYSTNVTLWERSQRFERNLCMAFVFSGEYSCLRTKMILRREFSYYLLQLYIPSFMLVIVSWVSFWLDKDSVPARVTLGVTTLLTMTTQSSGINAKLPPVSYTKAIDVWIGVCLAFIFGALLEFALVNYAARKDMTTGQRMLSKQRSQHADYLTSGYQPLTANPTRPSCCFRLFVRRYKERSKRIDVVSRLVFPIGYACFNGTFSQLPFCSSLPVDYRTVDANEYGFNLSLQFVNTAVPVSNYCFAENTGELIQCFPHSFFAVSYYLIQLYIPCIMLVVVSWVSFWLDKDAVPARVSLGVTTLLTMTTQASGINSKLPPVSYIKAVDVWIGVCLAFIFGALLEYALVNYHGRQEFLKKEKKKKSGIQECLCPSDQAFAQRHVVHLPVDR
ncbi:unnamed protein product [Toxocara canis]|uniref:Neur_chan_memb domain-containing protein n=1 Tax=Toxocara canis TaxID=6265 RepID=A0A183U0H0_TOXCA|nr:unnamed protein product [Toxocara canis]